MKKSIISLVILATASLSSFAVSAVEIDAGVAAALQDDMSSDAVAQAQKIRKEQDAFGAAVAREAQQNIIAADACNQTDFFEEAGFAAEEAAQNEGFELNANGLARIQGDFGEACKLGVKGDTASYNAWKAKLNRLQGTNMTQSKVLLIAELAGIIKAFEIGQATK